MKSKETPHQPSSRGDFKRVPEYSGLAPAMAGYNDELISKKELLSAPPFEDMSPKAKAKRVTDAMLDYWRFDSTYFPDEMYSGGYYPPCSLHKTIAALSQKKGVHIIFGPRGHGKTVTAKKVLIWLLITGQVRIAGTYSETIDKARNILDDIAELIRSNARITADFEPEFKINNADKLQLRFKAPGANDKQWRFVQAFSEGRSVRGYGRLFMRPQFLLGDDIETLESSMQPDAVERRINKLAEGFQSLSEKARTFLILGNDFDRGSALHRIRIEQENNILAKSWRVYVFKAWLGNHRPLWRERYRAKSEDELKKILQPRNEADWQANFQQNPIPPAGFYFKAELIRHWEAVPDDCKGVLYCDPNISKKGMGDTTAMTALKFSPTTQQYYVTGVRCKSFSGSTELLDAIFEMADKHNIRAIAMDGHVAQESIWTDNIRNWSRLKKRAFPKIEFKRLNIDDLAKNVQLAFEAGEILFPPDFGKSPESEAYQKQMISFSGKKAGKKDDAPDSLIGAFDHLHFCHFVRRGKNLLALPSSGDSIVIRMNYRI